MMTKRNTKEVILLEALHLFAHNGYDGVSVRDIANAVGIMQSSLYKHYASKQAIFDTLVQTMQLRFQKASLNFQLPQGSLEESAKAYATSGNNVLNQISSAIFHYYLKDPYASQFRKMLLIERYKNKAIETIYKEIFIDTALKQQTSLFAEMIKQGFMREADPAIMALQFFSPIFLLLHIYDCIPEQENEALKCLEKHIEQFDAIYRKE